MALINPVANQPGVFLMQCPGCEMLHAIYTQDCPAPNQPKWAFNNDVKSPTFSPSLLVQGHYKGQDFVCHSFIRSGHWQFLNDCTHALAGKTVPMLEVD
ncbi:MULTISPECIES: DUF6527 family protein [Pseudoalteromonas]|uniref:DUF6527 family protein n=1 Tax=Pseudoalteromonas TaxID=53246 RepID=UPI00272B5C7A|nr:DUF6527 family protein [Pseudoalteromonas sp.]